MIPLKVRKSIQPLQTHKCFAQVGRDALEPEGALTYVLRQHLGRVLLRHGAGCVAIVVGPSVAQRCRPFQEARPIMLTAETMFIRMLSRLLVDLPTLELVHYSSGGVGWGLVFPYPYYEPTILLQSAVGILIPALVRFDLLAPKFGVRFGLCAVNWTPMPEAAIHEDGNLLLSKEDIGFAVEIGQGSHIGLVFQAELVECLS